MNNESYNQILENLDNKRERNERKIETLDKIAYAGIGLSMVGLTGTVLDMGENPVVSAVGIGTAMVGAVVNFGAKIVSTIYASKAQQAMYEKLDVILEHGQQVLNEVAKDDNNNLNDVNESEIDEMAIDEFDM